MTAVGTPTYSALPIHSTAALALLRQGLAQTVSSEATGWLEEEIERQRRDPHERRLQIVLGLVSRKLGRSDLLLTEEQLSVAEGIRPGWQPQVWAAAEAGRVALLLASHRGEDRALAARLDQLCATAEINEHLSYLKGFAIFPAGNELLARAREAMRSSIPSIFNAIACRNPYPCEHFDEAAWNQMVVKAVFNGASIGTIFGLDYRRNPQLTQMLRDFVSERHAAGRPLPEEVHLFIGRCSD
jgi:hypothetical protein